MSMLKKFIAVRGVGRFITSALPGVPACLKTTLVLGGNGFGKTTLCSILRSLAANDPAIIAGRARLGAATTPEIELLLEGGTVSFRNGAWSAPAPEFLVFDGTFIADNVYAGDVVDLEQRRNLYRVIVGKQGVALAIEEERLAGESRARVGDIKAFEKAIQGHVPAGMMLDDFVRLPADADIDARIAAQTLSIEAVKASETVRARPALSLMPWPELPPNLETLLAQTLEGIAEDAQRLIAEHIAHQGMDEHAEAWLEEGTEHAANDKCPYCGQSVKGLALIDAYRHLFADSYRDLKSDVERVRTAIEREFGERAAASFDALRAANQAAVEFWSRYCKLPELPDVSAASKSLRDICGEALARLRLKSATPQEGVPANADFRAATAQFATTRQIVGRYNAAVDAANAEVAAKKAAVAAGELKKEEAALVRLKAQKKRHDSDLVRLCDHRQRLMTEKDAFDKSKVEVRAKLEQHTRKVIKPYEARINQLLDNFNAGFQIAQTKAAYPGGVASSTYQIVINNTGVDLGDGKTPTDLPSFKNTLSAGDRSTLALAVFIAHLERDPDRANRVVVFDDPFTSQDSFRRRQTIHEIKRAGDACKQLIVFSHDATFLRDVRAKCNVAECTVLQLADHRSFGIKIMPCDLTEATWGRAASDMDDLQAFITTGAGKDRDIVRKMRVVLETHCRSTYSGSFEPDDRLGGMVERIKKAGDQHPAWALADELEPINEYSRDHHHGEDPQDGAADLIDPQELTGFVKRTLRIVNNLQA
jgi:wobble nucleotide-excising tRNase